MKELTIAMVAGEPSGDKLGAGLIKELKNNPHYKINFIGIGGPEMIAQGLKSFIDIEVLSVMGLSDILFSYLRIKKIKKNLLKHLLSRPLDLFIGIDYSYFNLAVEHTLKKNSIKTIQFISPKIWAWRSERIKKIKKSVDMMLVVFPFEENLYKKYNIPVKYIGHPFADSIKSNNQNKQLRFALNINLDDTVICLLPGSRLSEIKHMGPLFFKVIKRLSQFNTSFKFVMPVVNLKIKEKILCMMDKYNFSDLILIESNSYSAMAISDIALVKSGTATFEVMLHKKPMVVVYKWNYINHLIIGSQVKIPFISLPNILAGYNLVPEFIQSEAKPTPISNELIKLLEQPKQQVNKFENIHKKLKNNAYQVTALSIFSILEGNKYNL